MSDFVAGSMDDRILPTTGTGGIKPPMRMEITMRPGPSSVKPGSPFSPVENPGHGIPDLGKPRIDLIPPEVIFAMAEILTFGAAEHGARGWENGRAWSATFAALMRHLWSWWRGESLDPVSGRSHLWHAAARIAFLIAYEARRTGTDDRPRATPKQED